MIEEIAEASSSPRARITGVVYLLFFLTTIPAELLIRGLVVSGDAAATANNIWRTRPCFACTSQAASSPPRSTSL